MNNFAQRTLNIGCMGEVQITVESDGWWEIRLDSKRDHNRYFRTRGTMLPREQMYCGFQKIELPEWMFDQFHATIDELTMELERDALDAPQYRQELPV